MSILAVPTWPQESQLEIRELMAGDRAAVTYALRHLGERSRYQRYLTGSGPPERGEVRRLTRVDHWHHEVLMAFRTHPRIPLGVAEYVRAAAFDEAEVAIFIGDAWQHQGVGRALISELRDRALKAGIRRFTATTAFNNRGATSLLNELGPARTLRAGGGSSDLVVPLAPEPGTQAGTETTSTATFSFSVRPSV